MRNLWWRWAGSVAGMALLLLVVWNLVRGSAARAQQQSASTVETENLPLFVITNPAPGSVPLAALPLFRNIGSLTSGAATSAEAFARFQPPDASSSSTTSTALSAWIRGMTTDRQGDLWIVTEDRGVFRFGPNATTGEPGVRFSTANGLGDEHLYCVATDLSGWIFVGHLNHGVSVFNPEAPSRGWQNYDTCNIAGTALNGPLGERVFCIKVNPIDGDTWIASNKGLTRYQAKQDKWSYYTKTEGLPDQILTLAFDEEGTLYAGTACSGLAIASSSDNYRTWRVVRGADERPLQPAGDGLPSNLINDVLVAHDGTVWVATTTGLAWSKDKGSTWKFVRGQNFFRQGGVLPEDYVTCLAEDPDSELLWVGFRQRGCGVLDPATMRYSPLVDGVYAMAILFRDGESPLLGTYGDGLIDPLQNKPVTYAALPSLEEPGAGTGSVSLPSPAPPPTLADLNAMLQEVGAVASVPEGHQPTILALPDDWRTQGDWLGRYGKFWSSLAALPGGRDYLWGAGHQPVAYAARMGPNTKPGDSLRYWVQWLYTDDPRCLEMPPVYYDSRVAKGLTSRGVNKTRRAAEWDDHGEGYSMADEGPNIYYTVQIPPGQFYLSLYEVNLNGNVERNRYRDFLISVRPHSPGAPLQEVERFHEQPEWARTRVRDFYGGVWKRFLVRGPTELSVEINRNFSFNSMLAAVMLDLVDEDPPPYFHSVAEWTALNASRKATLSSKRQRDYEPALTETEAVTKLVEGLQRAQLVNPEWWAANQAKYFTLLARWLGGSESAGGAKRWTNPAMSDDTRSVLYHLRLHDLWESQQRARGLAPARDIEKALRWDGDPYCSGKGRQFIERQTALMKGGH